MGGDRADQESRFVRRVNPTKRIALAPCASAPRELSCDEVGVRWRFAVPFAGRLINSQAMPPEQLDPPDHEPVLAGILMKLFGDRKYHSNQNNKWSLQINAPDPQGPQRVWCCGALRAAAAARGRGEPGLAPRLAVRLGGALHYPSGT
jgi:hypothetical protein